MLTNLVVDNFKAFGTRQEIALAPITLIFGSNSAGKSSLIQALLLLRQSLVSNEPIPIGLQRSAELVVRGAFVDLGSYDALIHGHDRNRAMTIGIGSDPSTNPRPGGVAFPPGSELTLEWKYERRRPTNEIEHVETAIRFENERVAFAVSRSSPDPFREGGRLREISTLSARDTATIFGWAQRLPDRRKATVLPSGSRGIVRLAAGVPVELMGFEQQIRVDEVVRVGDDPDGSDQLDQIRRQQSRDDPAIERVSNWFRSGPVACRSELSRISYLGPMRAAPARLNVLTGERVRDAGISGEHVVDLLARSPRLLGQVNEWLERLEIPYTADIRRVSDELVAGAIGEVHCLLLRDRRTGIEVSPTDVGFGIGQVLPVVVQSLLQQGGVLCIEQPEIHLHPALQARLAELFAGQVARGVPTLARRRTQFILETHSEHLILRLQRLVRRGTLNAEDISVLYVGFDGDGNSSVRRLHLSESGDFVDEWPSGFFGERFDEVFGE